MRAFRLCDFVKFGGDLPLPFRLRRHVAALFARGLLLGDGEVAAAEGAPGCECHALVAGHRDDVALKVAVGGGPAALVDAEWAEAVIAGV